jgi:membrane protease subunit HflC
MSRLTWASIVFLVAAGLLWLIFSVFTYSLDERDAALVTLFGEVRGEPEMNPGLHLKNPLASVTRIRTFMQEYNTTPEDAVTKDKKNIKVSFYVKYRVTDPLEYSRSVTTKSAAEDRIDDVVYSQLKRTVAKTTFDEVVINRTEIEKATLEQSQEKVRKYGIELIDFQIKRTDLPKQILDSVYKRMREERAQKAQTDRSEGEREKQIAIAEADKEKTRILSEAYRTKQQTMGEGDQEALNILSEAYGQDVEFAMFMKTLDLYRDSLKASDTHMILSTRNDLLKYLKQISPTETEK